MNQVLEGGTKIRIKPITLLLYTLQKEEFIYPNELSLSSCIVGF